MEVCLQQGTLLDISIWELRLLCRLACAGTGLKNHAPNLNFDIEVLISDPGFIFHCFYLSNT